MLIAIVGAAKSGRTTVARFIATELRLNTPGINLSGCSFDNFEKQQGKIKIIDDVGFETQVTYLRQFNPVFIKVTCDWVPPLGSFMDSIYWFNEVHNLSKGDQRPLYEKCAEIANILKGMINGSVVNAPNG